MSKEIYFAKYFVMEFRYFKNCIKNPVSEEKKWINVQRSIVIDFLKLAFILQEIYTLMSLFSGLYAK